MAKKYSVNFVFDATDETFDIDFIIPEDSTNTETATYISSLLHLIYSDKVISLVGSKLLRKVKCGSQIMETWTKLHNLERQNKCRDKLPAVSPLTVFRKSNRESN